MASKGSSDTPYLSPWWTNLSEIWYTFNLTQVTKCIEIFAKLNHQELRYGVSDGTFEAKKDQPKLDIRTLLRTANGGLTLMAKLWSYVE